jgi:diguanylate cyclase (GGDEF)-like protein
MVQRAAGEYPKVSMKKAPASPTLEKKRPQRARAVFAGLAHREQVLATLDLPRSLFKESEVPSSARRRRSNAETTASAMPESGARPLRVLLVEDDVSGGDTTVRERVSEGFRMRRAPSLDEACVALGREQFDVVLLDLRARDAAATESIARLKEACSEIPIVVWNADGGTAEADAMHAGASGFVSRPQTDVKLARSLRAAVERHQEYLQFQRLLQVHPDGVLVLDNEDRVVFANPAALELFGQTADALVGGPFAHAAHAANGGDFRVEVASGRTAEIRTSDIEWEGRSCRLLCLRDVTERLLAHQRIANLVNELLTTNQKLVHQASQDPLTGLLNRRGLQEVLVDELARMNRASSTLSAMLVDCDDFKGINDTLGYAMGDAALVIVANTLRATLRPQDRAGRVGGDEFIVLLPATRPTEASLVGQRLLQELSVAALPPELRERRLTVSIGVDRVPAEASTIEEVITAASAPLKVAKSRGKQRVSTAGGHPMVDVAIDEGHDVSAILSDASSLRVASQSIVRMVDGRVIANELLVRGPRGDLEQPSVLFALASSANSLITFDLNCLRASIATRAQMPRSVRCHVNIHPATLIGVPIATILDIIGRTLRPHELCIELSEQRLVGSPMRLQEARNVLRSRGIDVALDDVGFGHSSLEALIVLEPDIVKIDRRFVHGVSKDAGRSRDLRRLAGVLQGLGAEVIAEGVESRHDIETLIPMGIEFGQGYFWDKPTEVMLQTRSSSARTSS